MPVRVGIWGTGNIGRAAIRMVDGNPDLELVGVIVSNPAKVKLDAGEIALLDRPLGLFPTTDPDEVLKHVDAIAYCATADGRAAEAKAEILHCLASGVSVVTPAHYPLFDPASAPADLRAEFEAACRKGNSTFLATGIDPGWCGDVLPLMLTGLTSEFSEVRIIELFDYSTYDVEVTVREACGFGMPMDYLPHLLMPGVISMIWGPQIRLVARALGLEIAGLVEHFERRPLEHTITNQLGEFAQGTQGAFRFEVRGMVDGHAAIVVEHVTRIVADIAPDWPSPQDGSAGAHMVKITGRPNIEVSVVADDEGKGRANGANATLSGRIVDAIPALVAAAPGMIDAVQVPIGIGKGRYRPR
jgi:2,4-diaminopentanoate dehydrogenase